MFEILFDLISDALTGDGVDISDATETVTDSTSSVPDLKFGSYPSEIDSSYHPYVDAENNAYLSQDDYIHGNNKYVPK